MNKNIINVIAFAAGAAVGSLVTWKVVKTKYERITQEEIASVKETWARLARENSDECDGESEDDSEEDEDDEPEDDDEDYDESDYIQYNELTGSYKHDGEGEGDDEVPYINGPYLITPEEFGNAGSEYELHSITYYSDGVLADDWDVILDLDDTIGEDSIEHFGDHVDDVIHVRNERLMADYEVVRDDRTYTDVLATRPQAKAYGY